MQDQTIKSQGRADQRLRVRVSKREMDQIDRAAERAGTTRSGLVRGAVNLLVKGEKDGNR